MISQQGRLSLLRNLQEAHKKDIKTYVSGHLNQNKLHKFEEKNGHEAWGTSLGAAVRYVWSATGSFHHPVIYVMLNPTPSQYHK